MRTLMQIIASFPAKRKPGSATPGADPRVSGQAFRSLNFRPKWVPGFAGMTVIWASATGAFAQTVAGDQFADGKDGAKLHVASSFVCPAKIDEFERDAVGETNPQTGADFCAYSALDGVYGTITLVPAQGAYDPKQLLADDFALQEGTGGKQIAERTEDIATPGQKAPLAVYVRTYETASLEELHYRVTYTSAVIGNWIVETTLEYAEPRDTTEAQQFLRAVYSGAAREIGRPQ